VYEGGNTDNQQIDAVRNFKKRMGRKKVSAFTVYSSKPLRGESSIKHGQKEQLPYAGKWERFAQRQVA